MSDNEIAELLMTIRHIALVGASDKTHRASFSIMAWLLGQGYKVTPVSPALQGQTLLGQRVYASLAEITEAVDMVDVFRNSEAACEVAQQAVAIGAKALWLQLGVINPQATKIAEQAGLQVVMDRCPKIEFFRLGLNKR